MTMKADLLKSIGFCRPLSSNRCGPNEFRPRGPHRCGALGELARALGRQHGEIERIADLRKGSLRP